MTNKEWQKQYPEDWYQASEAKNFNPDQYDFVWNEDYSAFRAVRLAWGAGNAAYIQYQAGGV